MQQTAPVSTPAAPPPAAPPPAEPTPVVPYGPGPGARSTPAPSPFSGDISPEGVAKGVGRTALKWGIRIAIPFLLQAIFRAIAKR